MKMMKNLSNEKVDSSSSTEVLSFVPTKAMNKK